MPEPRPTCVKTPPQGAAVAVAAVAPAPAVAFSAGCAPSSVAVLVRPRRLAVALYLQGHSVPEAAKLLEWGNKRTENLVYRGLADLRECLAKKGLKP